MMKLWILSDLHFHPSTPPAPTIPPGVDVAVIAGDVCEGAADAVEWLSSEIRSHGVEVISVLGNHEFYHHLLEGERRIARKVGDELGVYVLDDRTIEISGVRFIGATLWTDYLLYAGGEEHHAQAYMLSAKRGLNDHRLITVGPYADLFQPADALRLHQTSRAFIEAELAKPFDGPTVVVSHHCPHPNSVPRAFAGDKLTPAFASDLSDIIERYQPTLWIHGHTHSSFDYQVGRTRVICNPKGYGAENPEFRWDLVVEV
jgi:Icc-related predicted phosphoesterase